VQEVRVLIELGNIVNDRRIVVELELFVVASLVE
jgi:hypothetical protein